MPDYEAMRRNIEALIAEFEHLHDPDEFAAALHARLVADGITIDEYQVVNFAREWGPQRWNYDRTQLAQTITDAVRARLEAD